MFEQIAIYKGCHNKQQQLELNFFEILIGGWYGIYSIHA